MESRDTCDIQDQAAKLLKTIVIVVWSLRRSMTKYSHEENAAVTFKMQMHQVNEKVVEEQFQDSVELN